MHYNPSSPVDRIEKSRILANRIMVKALQSERGDLIRVMNDLDLTKMMESVARAVHSILAKEAQRAYDFKIDNYAIEQGHVKVDTTAKFELMSDVEIEEEVSAYFEIDGKLQYRT